MNQEDFATWYYSLSEEDKLIANGLIVISTTSPTENDDAPLFLVRKHVYDGFQALKRGQAERKAEARKITRHIALNDNTDYKDLEEWLAELPGKFQVSTGHDGLHLYASHELMQGPKGMWACKSECITQIDGKLYVNFTRICPVCNPKE